MFSVKDLILIYQVNNEIVICYPSRYVSDKAGACGRNISSTWHSGCSGSIPVKAPSSLVHWIKSGDTENNSKIPYNLNG